MNRQKISPEEIVQFRNIRHLAINKRFVKLLCRSRFVYKSLFNHRTSRLQLDCSKQAASDLIKNTIACGKPCMICRFGNLELYVTLMVIDISDARSILSKSLRFIKGDIGPFWWDDDLKHKINMIAGFFPPEDELLAQFGKRMLNDIQNIDILGSWVEEEVRLAQCFPQAKIVQLVDLEPYFHDNPWSQVLTGKKVLVIHPFEKSIRGQYAKRHLLFDDPRILPDFELITFKSVLSLAGNKVDFADWFQALGWMCEKISHIDFDIAIVGAGAYGLPLASYIKKIGKMAVHLGGATQILFGIKGNRWDKRPFYQQLYNEDWIRALPSETPKNFQSVEYGCYW